MALRLDDVDLHRDRALVERFQAGDSGAFDTLYLRYFERLKRFCLKRVGDAHEAEEIAQEAFVRAYRALPSFGGERRFYPWMTVIAARLCVDTHRRRERSTPSAEIDLGAVDGGQEQLIDRSDVMQLTVAMERLAPRHREVLEFREQHEWTYQQIADHYGVTIGTVEALLFRARKALKREFSAVNGAGRGFAALPVLAPVFRRIATWRARIEGLLPSLSPLAGSAMAVALAVGTTGAMVASDVPSAAAPPKSVPVVRTLEPASQSVDAAVPVESITSHHDAGPRPARISSGPAAAAPTVESGGFGVAAAGADGHTTEAPGGTLVAVNPEGVAQDAGQLRQQVREGVKQWVDL